MPTCINTCKLLRIIVTLSKSVQPEDTDSRSAFQSPKSLKQPDNNRKQDFMLALLRNETEKFRPSSCALERMKESLNIKSAFPNIKSATEPERRTLIQNSIRSLETVGLVGSALAAMLPFGGSWKCTFGMRLCAPIIAMTIAETYLSTITEGSTSTTQAYVLRLFQVLTDPDSDSSIYSQNGLNLLEVLASIGVQENQKRTTLPVVHSAGNLSFPVAICLKNSILL